MKNRRGQTLVESTLVMIVFLGLLLGFIDAGQLLFTRQTLADRVRTAARWASVRPYDETAVRNMVLYNQPEASDDKGFLGLSAGNVEIERLGQGTPNERIQVAIVNYEYAFVSPWLGAHRSARAAVETVPVE
ncbi:MAG: pilus assembly protein [Candidatus Solibacter usitatus]|nr:pilus assembly protein [Candidatus Solibacter usitatus]